MNASVPNFDFFGREKMFVTDHLRRSMSWWFGIILFGVLLKMQYRMCVGVPLPDFAELPPLSALHAAGSKRDMQTTQGL